MALISFILLAIPEAIVQVQMLVWIFVMRIMMVVASGLSYLGNEAVAKARYQNATKMNFEAPLTSLVWVTSIVSVALTFLVSKLLIPDIQGDTTLWLKLSAIITCGTLAGAIIPELVKVFTSMESPTCARSSPLRARAAPRLNILSGLVAGNFSAYWLGLVIMLLMGIAYGVSTTFPGGLMLAPAVFAFGLVAFGFLGMGPVTIAVDSYGPVTDNAQSVFELSTIEQMPGACREEIKSEHGFDVQFERAKHLLEENDGAGNTFKATAKPVLIGTAVVGATTMIFSIIVALTAGLHRERGDAVGHAPALPARPHRRRRGDLLVHRGVHPGRHHRRLPGGGVHQAEHQAARAPPRPRWPTPRRSWRSAPSTRRRGCSTSSWPSSSPPWPSPSWSRSSSSAT